MFIKNKTNNKKKEYHLLKSCDFLGLHVNEFSTFFSLWDSYWTFTSTRLRALFDSLFLTVLSATVDNLFVSFQSWTPFVLVSLCSSESDLGTFIAKFAPLIDFPCLSFGNFLRSIFSAVFLKRTVCDTNMTGRALTFSKEVAGHMRNLMVKLMGFHWLALPRQFEAWIRFINTNEKYWTESIFQLT